MAAPEIRTITRIKGRLVRDPTSFASAPDYGGTPLGLVAVTSFDFAIRSPAVEAVEHGDGQEIDFAYMGANAAMSAVLRSWDKDAIQAAFPHTTIGATTGVPFVTLSLFGTGSKRPGTFLGPDAMAILLAPDAPDHEPAIYLPSAVPVFDTTARLQTSLAGENFVAVSFKAQPDTSGRLALVGMLADLTL